MSYKVGKIFSLSCVLLLVGCMDAETQARDIKHCQSVGQDYWYNGFNQIFCKPKNK